MPNITLGLLKKIFVQAMGRLVAQKHTGASAFDYNRVGLDGTNMSGLNNVFAADPDETFGKRKDCIRSVAWVEPTGGKRAVVSHYRFHHLNTNPVASPALAIKAKDVQPFITVNGKYVAKFGEGRTDFFGNPQEDIYPWGGAHIQNIAGTDHLVVYQLIASSSGFEIRKYKAILDETIDQELIELMVFDKSLTHTGESDFRIDSVYYDQEPDDGGVADGATEWANRLPRSQRILVCNNDGSKTIFFGQRRISAATDWNEHEYNPIFVLTDTEAEFSYAEIFQYENIRDPDPPLPTATITAGGQSFSTSTTTRSDACTPQENTSTNSSSNANWDHTELEHNHQHIKTRFLGCAFDRFTDLPIIVFKRYGSEAFDETITASMSETASQSHSTGSDSTRNLSNHYVVTKERPRGVQTWSEKALIIKTIGGGEKVVFSGAEGFSRMEIERTVTAPSYLSLKTITRQESTVKWKDTTNFAIIDLAYGLVAFKVDEGETHAEFFATVETTEPLFPDWPAWQLKPTSPPWANDTTQARTHTYLYANGDVYSASATPWTDLPRYYIVDAVGFNAAHSNVGQPGSSTSTDTGTPLEPCENGSATTTSTTTYSYP